MHIVIYATIFFCIFVIYRLKDRTILYPFFVGIFLFMIAIYSKPSFESAKYGLDLWFYTVLPSLFPFIVGSNLLIHLGFVEFIGILLEPIMQPLFHINGNGSFALAMGMTSGYPVGARITASLREKALISKEEAERLISFTNNSGPLFIIGAVSVGMFHIPKLGFFLLLVHYLSAFTVGFLFRFYKYNAPAKKVFSKTSLLRKSYRSFMSAQKKQNTTFGILLAESIKDSIQLLLQIGGFIVLFSVLLQILDEIKMIDFITLLLQPLLSLFHIDAEIAPGYVKGMLEITNGIKDISNTNIHLLHQLCATSFLIAWSGVSIHFQTISILSKTDIRISIYLFAKFLQAMFAWIYTFFLYPFFLPYFQSSVVTFSSLYHKFTFQQQIQFSFYTMFAVLISLIPIALLSRYFYQSYNKN